MNNNPTPDGLHTDRLKQGAHSACEIAFAEQWKSANINSDMVRLLLTADCAADAEGAFYVSHVLGGCAHARHPIGPATKRDRVVAATVIQWLGTNCGRAFLADALRKAGYSITEDRRK